MDKHRIVKPFQKRLLNPLVQALVRPGLVRGWAILETLTIRIDLDPDG